MSDIERGFHPGQRLVHRLGKISPHRQVQLLGLISVVTVGIIVGTVFAALAPTHSSLRNSNDKLVPATEQLDLSRQSYNATASVLPLTISGDITERNAAVSQLTSLNAAGEAAWKKYLKISADLPGERAVQRKFAVDREAGIAAGVALVSGPSVIPDELLEATRSTAALRLDLNALKAMYEKPVELSLRNAGADIDATERIILLVSAATLLVMLIAFGVAARSARAREERLDALDRALHQDAERNELEARLQRSLEMARTETAVYAMVGRALSANAPGLPAELLVADSSRAHFHQATATDEHGGPGCAVMSPADCPAATWSQTQIWNSSTALDACPYLQGRPGGECSAVCVPVSIGGNTVGVVHAVAPDAQPPSGLVVEKIELIARKVGERVGMLRAFSRSETQAHTDPLTGLMNRRSLEEKVRGITGNGLTYVAVYADLDHFKQLNDVHGHDAGDQALRLFARVVRDIVRPDDLTARYGGEEFVVVFPDTQISDAYSVINRLRERLANAQSGAGSPHFTASFGITAARPEDTFSQTLEIADGALLKAKGTGRDRIVIAGSESSPPPGPDASPPGAAAPERAETPSPS